MVTLIFHGNGRGFVAPNNLCLSRWALGLFFQAHFNSPSNQRVFFGQETARRDVE